MYHILLRPQGGGISNEHKNKVSFSIPKASFILLLYNRFKWEGICSVSYLLFLKDTLLTELS